MKTVRRLMEHMWWADRQLCSAFRAMSDPGQGTLRLYSHLVAAEQIWLLRLQGNDSTAVVLWPDHGLDASMEQARRNKAGYIQYVSSLSAEDLDRDAAYRNQSGASFATTIRDILTHVAMHGQYHRGQINQSLRASGLEPAYVDFIGYARKFPDRAEDGLT